MYLDPDPGLPSFHVKARSSHMVIQQGIPYKHSSHHSIHNIVELSKLPAINLWTTP